jgi:hypothetical protein
LRVVVLVAVVVLMGVGELAALDALKNNRDGGLDAWVLYAEKVGVIVVMLGVGERYWPRPVRD